MSEHATKVITHTVLLGKSSHVLPLACLCVFYCQGVIILAVHSSCTTSEERAVF
jgi:hypothetical protein